MSEPSKMAQAVAMSHYIHFNNHDWERLMTQLVDADKLRELANKIDAAVKAAVEEEREGIYQLVRAYRLRHTKGCDCKSHVKPTQPQVNMDEAPVLCDCLGNYHSCMPSGDYHRCEHCGSVYRLHVRVTKVSAPKIIRTRGKP